MSVSSAFFLPSQGAFRVALSACLLALVVLSAATDASAQRRHGPSPLDTVGDSPSQEEGWEILQNFRSLGIAEEYRFRFQLEVMPRRGDTRRVPGLMLGTMGERGPVTRVDIVLEQASISDRAELVPAEVKRLLLQNGISPHAFEAEGDEAPELVPPDRYFEPIAGSDFTIFDLLMPYTYWQNFNYEGRTKFRGRPAHVFWLYPPEDDELLRQHVSGVRIHLDEEFNALLQAELYDAEEEHRKTVSIVDFKKVDDHWILGQVDVRDEYTRDKTRFKVTDASVGVDLPREVFTPQGLTEDVHGTDIAFARVGDASAGQGVD